MGAAGAALDGGRRRRARSVRADGVAGRSARGGVRGGRRRRRALGVRVVVGDGRVKATHPHRRRDRARGALVGLAVVLGLLLVQFFRVQVVRSSEYMLRSEENRLRQVPLPAPRGTIFDRNGHIIADNVPGYAVYVLPAPLDSIRHTLERLQPTLSLSDARVAFLMSRVQRHRPLLVDLDAPIEAVAFLQEHRGDFPGVYIEMQPKRRYHEGRAVSHVVGYLSEITAEELESERFQGYEPGQLVGRTGIERQYEELLQGRQGVRNLEVDASGRVVDQDFQGRVTNPAVPGEDLRLNLDLELQAWIDHIFPDSARGAVVALDPSDGGILALYSAPTYDPNDFVGGIDADTWAALNGDPRKPLLNRTVMGRYAPASTWKVATAGIALDLGVVTPEEHMPIPCTGGMWHNGLYRRCWKPEGHGSLDLAGAIAHSCNVYFYQLGLRIGLDNMLRRATDLGFNRECGVDLPQELPGRFPADRQFWVDVFGYEPLEGEVLSLALGQGPNDQTPLKMAQFYVALARDGSAPAPRLRAGGDPGHAWRLDLSRGAIEALREGLRQVTAPGGTAYYSTALEYWEVIGKTGTGQNPQDPDRPHAWFAGMAGPRGGEPEIVVVALVEFGESGSAAAAPLVAKAADFYLRRKHGIPVDTIQTLAEHIRAGRPAPWARERPTPGEEPGLRGRPTETRPARPVGGGR
ncbi:MAG: penicillin-binding protein 2 [Gemmatimonadetes bacterium]|nr:MAG: penicillin-binding protein 2 [Gemmatimonadota bacterium]